MLCGVTDAFSLTAPGQGWVARGPQTPIWVHTDTSKQMVKPSLPTLAHPWHHMEEGSRHISPFSVPSASRGPFPAVWG